MYGETALPGSLTALFYDIFFNLSISTDSDFPDDFRTRISDIIYIFHFSNVGTPVYTENQTKWRRLQEMTFR